MWKQIALRGALPLVCALQLGLAGCGNKTENANATPGVPPPMPQSQVDQIKSLPPDVQQRIKEQMANKPGGGQINQAVGGGTAPDASGKSN